MPKTHLTDLSVNALTPPLTGQITYWDSTMPRFGVRVSQGGTKTFTVMHGERRKRTTIGRYPVVSLAKARAEAKRILAETILSPKTLSITFEAAIELYLAKHCAVNNKPVTALRTERLLKRHFLPRLARKSLADIKTAHIVNILDALLHTPGTCNSAFAAIRAFFRFACRRRYIKHSPCETLQRPTKPVFRSRVLAPKELVAVYRAAGGLGVYGAIVGLLILTGQRLNEIATLRGSYIDTKQKRITLPAEVTKNGREHTFPYGERAAEIINAHLNDGLLFPTEKNADAPFSGFFESKKALDSFVRCLIGRTTTCGEPSRPISLLSVLRSKSSRSSSVISQARSQAWPRSTIGMLTRTRCGKPSSHGIGISVPFCRTLRVRSDLCRR